MNVDIEETVFSEDLRFSHFSRFIPVIPGYANRVTVRGERCQELFEAAGDVGNVRPLGIGDAGANLLAAKGLDEDGVVNFGNPPMPFDRA